MNIEPKTAFGFRQLQFTEQHVQQFQAIVTQYGTAVGTQISSTEVVKGAVAWEAFRVLEATAKTAKKCSTPEDYASVRTSAQAAKAIGASVDELMKQDLQVLIFICMMDGRYSSDPSEALAQIVTNSINRRDSKSKSNANANNQAPSSMGTTATNSLGALNQQTMQQAPTVDTTIELPQNNGNGSRAAASFVN